MFSRLNTSAIVISSSNLSFFSYLPSDVTTSVVFYNSKYYVSATVLFIGVRGLIYVKYLSSRYNIDSNSSLIIAVSESVFLEENQS